MTATRMCRQRWLPALNEPLPATTGGSRMNPEIFENSPFRRPQWRADRVMQMVERQPSPLMSRYYDDTYVRTYRRLLLLLLAAGDDEVARFGVNRELSHAFQAHSLRFHSDRHLRDVLE